MLILLFRLILYYPIAALVTLFANILQNPHDVRACSDVKLMGIVVNFLSALASDESNGSVKRMLRICSEFERIARVVLARAKRESQSTRKRKSDENEALTAQDNPNSHDSRPSPNVHSAEQTYTQSTQDPQINNISTDFSSPGATEPQTSMPLEPDAGLVSEKYNTDYNPEFSNVMASDMANQNGFTPSSSFPQTDSLSVDLASLQQSFIPQDLWQMPMALEWDWSEISNNIFPYGSDGHN